MRTLCVQMRDCYRAAERGDRPISDCYALAFNFSGKAECEAYKVSVRCMQARLKKAACKGKHRDYALRKLASERCWKARYCEDG
jgi:hypothetical protein